MSLSSKDRKHCEVLCSVCGKVMQIRSDYVKKHSKVCMSCQKKGNKNAIKHSDYKARLYKIWLGLPHRRYVTYNPKVLFENYEEFRDWALKNGYAENLTIDRINPKGDYEPSNCQWITLEENAAKDKRIFRDDEKEQIYERRKELNITQKEMAKMLGISRTTMQRIERYAKETN